MQQQAKSTAQQGLEMLQKQAQQQENVSPVQGETRTDSPTQLQSQTQAHCHTVEKGDSGIDDDKFEVFLRSMLDGCRA